MVAPEGPDAGGQVLDLSLNLQDFGVDYCIVVTGLPGSGKSTVGKAVAALLLTWKSR